MGWGEAGCVCPSRMYDGMKRHQIQTLRCGSVSVSRTAALTGASERTVVRVSAEDEIEDAQEHDETARRRMGRPSKLAGHEEYVLAVLSAEPEIRSIAVVERLRQRGFEGGKSAVYAFVRQHRPPKAAAGIVRFEAVPGEFAQHDFGEVNVRYEDGSRERIQFFVSQLRYSRMVRVRLVADQKVETICHSLVDAYQFFGGMPLVGVFDNPRTIVTSREGDAVTWQETFASFCVECGFSPHVTWPFRPQEKGGVENAVGFVKSSHFKAHQFRDRAHLEESLALWHVYVNDERPSRATGEVPRQRLMLEAERLRPLKIDPNGYTLRYSRKVRTDGFVELHGVRYFAGFKHVGRVVTVRLGEELVTLELGTRKLEASVHPREPLNKRYSVLPEQRNELLAKAGARPFVKRQMLMEGCPAAEWLMTELRHRRPNQWEEEVERIFELVERQGEAAVREALIESARRGLVGSEYIVAILAERSAEEVVR